MSENVPRNMCAHRRFGLDCADGQADKSLCGCKSIRTFSQNATYTYKMPCTRKHRSGPACSPGQPGQPASLFKQTLFELRQAKKCLQTYV